jgi:hypothetical protein
MPALTGAEIVDTHTASGSVISSVPSSTASVALLAGNTPAPVNTPVANATGTTLTAAALLGGYITRTGPSAAFSDTLDTAANIIAALPAGTPLSWGRLILIRNLVAFPETLVTGTGVTLTGETVVPGNSLWVGLCQYTGAAAVAITGLAAIPIDQGAIEANTAITTVGSGTLTAAGLTGGVITRSGPTAAFTDTTDTAANIIAALPNPMVGQSWECSLINTTAWPMTLAGGTGVTLSGLASPVPANATARALLTYAASNAVSLQLLAINYDAASGYDPSTVQVQFGSSTGAFLEEGTINLQLSSAGVAPGSTGNDNVLAVYTLPANALDGTGNRGLRITAKGSFGATGNNKRIKLFFAATTATVGSAISGGTAVADTGTITTNGGGWVIEAEVYKYGAANSNTQLGTNNGMIAGASHLGTSAPVLLTATENATILIAVTGNATTATSDIKLNQLQIEARN